MSKASKAETADQLLLKLSSLIRDKDDELFDSQLEADRLRRELDRAPVDLSLEGESITAAALSAIGDWNEESQAWCLKYGRLFFFIRESGSWWAGYSGAFGGNVSSCRYLKNMAEVRVLVSLLGVAKFSDLAKRCESDSGDERHR